VGGGGLLDITFTVDGEETIVQQLATFGADIRDLSPAWEQIGEDVLVFNGGNFDYEGAVYDGAQGGWWPLAESTQRERARLGYGPAHPILKRTGTLEESLTVRGALGNVFEVRPDGLTIGTRIPYAKYHQHANYWNTGKGGSRLPRRTLVGLTDTMKTLVVNRLATYVRAQLTAINQPITLDGE